MNNLFNLTHLKFFCDAVALKSVSEAAKKNFVTQSTVSQGISKLEIVLGVQLAMHTRQNFQITEEGKIVYEQSSHIFKALRDMQNKLHESKEDISGEVHFVCTNSLGMSFIAPAFKNMRNTHPQVLMQFKLGNLNFIRSSLQDNRAEFAIVVFDQDFEQFNKIPLVHGKLRLYNSKEATPDLIEEGILIDYKEGMHVSRLQEYFQEHLGRKLKIQAELASWEVTARFTEMNIGVGFFPDYIISNNRYPTIKPYPIEFPNLDYEICAIYKKGERLSRAASLFIDQFGEGKT